MDEYKKTVSRKRNTLMQSLAQWDKVIIEKAQFQQ